MRHLEEDFPHPRVDPNHELSRHALYRMPEQLWTSLVWTSLDSTQIRPVGD